MQVHKSVAGSTYYVQSRVVPPSGELNCGNFHGSLVIYRTDKDKKSDANNEETNNCDKLLIN